MKPGTRVVEDCNYKLQRLVCVALKTLAVVVRAGEEKYNERFDSEGYI